MVRVSAVSRTYRLGTAVFEALRGVDLTAHAGEFVAIVGRSGSGKSTLLNLIAGIDRPSAGSVVVAGTDLGQLSENRLAAWRGRTVGVVFQFFQLLPTLTVAENVMLPMELSGGVPGARRRPRALELLDQVGIAALADKLPSTLSGGEQQRAAIARALANDPPVLVADEPTGNLDAATGDAVLNLLEGLAAAGTCVLMVTHERDIAERVPRTVTLADGRVAQDTEAVPC
ncbi:ABC transporter ATP-binding protein [Dactylosporangium roseum]|uniref:ABC transporter ATP-binding protein n=2 Tax=Dactylosporangium roseum TaxID=47989 RepID=A0ABY5ZGU6_9ACTN|nr:ABC transporter ATP-binding protein [Dactylosporangium roseum]